MTDAVNTGEPPMNKRPTPLARECVRIKEGEGRKKRRNGSYPTRLSRNLFHDCTKKKRWFDDSLSSSYRGKISIE